MSKIRAHTVHKTFPRKILYLQIGEHRKDTKEMDGCKKNLSLILYVFKILFVLHLLVKFNKRLLPLWQSQTSISLHSRAQTEVVTFKRDVTDDP